MAGDPKSQAALALHRFGFGPKAGAIAAIASDPRGALIAELDKKGAGLVTAPDLMSSAHASRAVLDFNAEPLISLVIGLILGKLAEGSFHQALMISDHDDSVFILRPLSATIFATCLVLILWPGVKKRLGHGGAEVT